MKMGIVGLTEKLVGFNTVSSESSTRPIADFISNLCEDAGFKTNQFVYSTSHEITDGSGKKRTESLEKVNLFAVKGGEEPVLGLSGHMDTVPYDRTKWQTNPFILTQRGNNYYGLGITDMKLFLATALIAGSKINATELKKPFALMFTSDEEVGCLGARKWLKNGDLILPSYIVIGEPSELIPYNQHKGYLYLKIKIDRPKASRKKIEVHSSDPRTAPNVLELALVPVLNGLLDLKERLKKISSPEFNPPYPTLNIGIVKTSDGAAKNIIAGECIIELDIRPVPGQDTEEILEKVNWIVQQAVEDIEGIQAEVHLGRSPTPPMHTPKESPIVQLVEKISRHSARSVCFNTEAGVFNEAGAQSVIWGPASIKQAHKPNEFASARWFQDDIVEKYVALIKSICCQGGF